MKTQTEKTEKMLKKEKAMLNNMLTHLKSNSIKCQIDKIKEIIIQEKTDKVEEIKIDELILNGYYKSNEKFNFKLSVHPEEINENGHPQVILQLEVESNKFIKMHPQTNGQLTFMIKNFQTGIEETSTIENSTIENSTPEITTKDNKNNKKK